MKQLETIAIVTLIIMIGALSFTLLIAVKTINDLESEDERFDYSRKTKGNIKDRSIYQYSYR